MYVYVLVLVNVCVINKRKMATETYAKKRIYIAKAHESTEESRSRREEMRRIRMIKKMFGGAYVCVCVCVRYQSSS